jgi:hypothetical protein
MILPAWAYRDPCLVLEQKQAQETRRTCNGCDHVKTTTDPYGKPYSRCVKGRPIGKRCKQFAAGDSAPRTPKLVTVVLVGGLAASIAVRLGSGPAARG